MKGDFTRFTHDPARHYTGVLKQQGRVDLDADTNEAAFIEDFLSRTSLRDIIGHCGFPEKAPGFEINFEASDDGEPDLSIGSGRGYVGGLLCRVPESTDADTISYLNQPFYPNPPPLEPANGGIDLVYLDVWQRHVTAIEDPDLRDVALGGPDTATRIQTVWQVKIREDVEVDVEPVDSPLTGQVDLCERCADLIAEIRIPRLSQRGRLSSGVVPVPPAEDPCVIGPGAGYRGLENRLYRVEIHDGGEPLNADPATQQAWTVDGAGTVSTSTADDWSVYRTPWRAGQLVEVSGFVENEEVHVLAQATAVDEGAQTISFDADEELNNLLQAAAEAEDTVNVRRIATFKWSRDNGSVLFAIESFDANDEITARRIRHDRVLALDLHDIVEIAGDETDLHGGPGTLAEIVELDQPERRLTLDADVSRHGGETHPKVRRWDQPSTSDDYTMHGGAIVVETGKTYELEDGIEVQFHDGSFPDGPFCFFSGDYWTFAARAASSTGQSSLEALDEAPPDGIAHYYCCLAFIPWIVVTDEDGTEDYDVGSIVDCRNIFPPLTGTVPSTGGEEEEEEEEEEEHVVVVSVSLGTAAGAVVPLSNDSDLTPQMLAGGIDILCDRPLLEASVHGGDPPRDKPVCFVTLYLPYPLSWTDRELWGTGTALVGRTPLVLAAHLKAENNTISWMPTEATQAWLLESLFNAMHGQDLIVDRLPAWLTLKGNFIWAVEGGKHVYLDGEVFGTLRDDGGTDVILPSGNGHAGGDLEMWFWLVPQVG